jgi:hypothetical protein
MYHRFNYFTFHLRLHELHPNINIFAFQFLHIVTQPRYHVNFFIGAMGASDHYQSKCREKNDEAPVFKSIVTYQESSFDNIVKVFFHSVTLTMASIHLPLANTQPPCFIISQQHEALHYGPCYLPLFLLPKGSQISL